MPSFSYTFPICLLVIGIFVAEIIVLLIQAFHPTLNRSWDGTGTATKHLSRHLERSCQTGEYRDEFGILTSLKPYSWELAKAKIKARCFVFGRSQDIARSYRLQLARTKTEWDSLDSYCKHTYLNIPFSVKTTNRTGLNKSVKFVSDSFAKPSDEDCTRIHGNEFPYYLTDDMVHHLIWSCEKQPWSVYLQLVESVFPPSAYEYLIYENPDRNKTVKSVHHLHVYTRKRLREAGLPRIKDV